MVGPGHEDPLIPQGRAGSARIAGESESPIDGGRRLVRMERTLPMPAVALHPRYRIVAYRQARHHAAIASLYGEAFGEPAWEDDWQEFAEFDPSGVMVAEQRATSQPVGFAISFQRDPGWYVSVVAVVPAHRRRGLARALVTQCSEIASAQSIQVIRIDAYEDSPPAVACYRELGFRTYAVEQVRSDEGR